MDTKATSSVLGETWFRRRSDLNHNQLRNQFLMKLGTALSILDKEVIRNDFEDLFCNSTLPSWITLREEIRDLVTSVVEETAPSQWISQWHAYQKNPEDYAWLAELVDELWKARNGIESLQEESLVRLKEADQQYARLTSLIPDDHTFPKEDAQIESFREALIAFYDACEGLSSCLARFPTDARA